MTAEDLELRSEGLITEKYPSQQSPGSKTIFSKVSLTEIGHSHANGFIYFFETYLITPLIWRSSNAFLLIIEPTTGRRRSS